MVPLNSISLRQFCINCINNAKFVLNLYSFLLPCPTDGPVNFVSPFALSGARPAVRRSRSWGHLPRCSRGAKTTRGEPGPGAGTRSAGRSPGWSHRTAGPRERAVSHGAGYACNKHANSGWGKANPVVSHSHHHYADLRPREEHSSLTKWLKLCPSFWATHSVLPIFTGNEFIYSVGLALLFEQHS